MKKFYKFLMPLAIASLFIVINGCSKDDDNGDEPVFVEPAFAGESQLITAPEGLSESTDYHAYMAQLNIMMVNAYTSMFSQIVPPEGATKVKSTAKSTTGSITYTWTDGIYSVWLTFTETATKYIWEYDIDMGNGRIDFIYAEQQKDGMSGSLKFNDPEIELSWDVLISWSINTDGSIIWSLTNYFDDEMVEIKCNSDYSGYVKFYENSILLYEIIWDALGNGSWTDYTEVPPLTGSWTV